MASGSSSSSDADRCPITLTPFADLAPDAILFLPCVHRFERAAILQYFADGNNRCPVCKLEIALSWYNIPSRRGRAAARDCAEAASGDDEEEDEAEEGDADETDAPPDAEEMAAEATAETLGPDDDGDEDSEGSVGSLVDFIEPDGETSDSDASFAPVDDTDDDPIEPQEELDEDEDENTAPAAV